MESTNVQTAVQLGLLAEEYDQICSILGREPNFTELSIYSVMWSEHCSYKNSIVWLKKLPKEGPAMLAKAGEENAGLVDIGDGLACCFKIESHNHPSAIEPYQGAATGVGGINRDIFSMGARPIAQLNSLRFGSLDTERTQWLVKGVVKGIGDYGNSFGIPTVGGEVYFDPCYETNILVNAMSVGLVEVGKTVSAIAEGIGNPVYIFGSRTGKDGIHGAAFASKDITEDSVKDLPAVQVGDPFYEKLILEASMEIIETGGVVGMQDMGAAGITCSTSEMSAKSGTGMEIHLDRVPLRQQDMKGWEILLSESQERMLVVVEKGKEEDIERVLAKWDLLYAKIGQVTDTGRVQYYMNGELEADIPAHSLVLGGGAPVYHRESRTPAYISKIADFDLNKVSLPESLKEVAYFMAALPNIASKKWVYRQYDSMVGTVNQSTNVHSDAALVRIRESEKSLALTVDCNSRYIWADPEKGTAIAVSEAARNIVCSGGIPCAITNCLNFGNPYDQEVYWQFSHAILGMKAACEKFKTPVTGGNVSFYNQSGDGTAVFPTPTIGMVGVVENQSLITGSAFQNPDDIIILLGPESSDLGSSQYLCKYLGEDYSPCPEFDLDTEYNVQNAISEIIRKGWAISCHDVSEGGLFIALMESAMQGKLGFSVETNPLIRKDACLFGESQSRAVISCSKENADKLMDYVKSLQLPVRLLGKVIEKNIVVDDELLGETIDFKHRYESTLPAHLEN